uniref:CD97 antigen-like n=1 Tax=Phallusia mammillata TaxID=59560 RepID=A0A6F9D8L7_9ASCI|nr:CD97 antigen-like [Phallusia mammillata]
MAVIDTIYPKLFTEVSPLHTMYRSRHVCWITGSPQLFGFIIPCISLFLFNCTLFGMLIAKLCKRRLITKNLASKKDFNREITIAVTMLTVMGFSWIFGYLALVSDDIYYYTVMSWLFAFFSSLQGLLIFLLTAVRRAELRNVWFSPIRTSVLKPLSRLGSRVITRVHSSTGSYLIQENSSMDATSPSSQSTQNVNLPGESTSTEGNSVHFVAVSKQVCLKGKSENFGTVRVKRTAPESANISYLYPINEEKA